MKKTRSAVLLMVFVLSIFLCSGCSSPQSSATESTSANSNSSSSSQAQDFSLNNETGIEIHELYLAPTGTNDWGSSLLDSGATIPNGESVPITFSSDISEQYWDLKVADSSGTTVQWTNLDLFSISNITLTMENGQPTANFE
jgi:hypothetical protein